MSEIAIITSVTEINKVNTSAVVETAYEEDILPDTVLGTLTTDVGQQEDATYIEGELLMRMKHSPGNVDYEVNKFGELILFSHTDDADNYGLDHSGSLIYTTEE